jgi:hypothetical protein
MSAAMKAFFLLLDVMLWGGIWLTGFGVVHWLLYIPAVFLLIAAVTGVCPGIIFLEAIFKEKKPGV